MDYFNNVISFLAFEHGSYICVQRFYGFGTTWGWVINDRIQIFVTDGKIIFFFLSVQKQLNNCSHRDRNNSNKKKKSK